MHLLGAVTSYGNYLHSTKTLAFTTEGSSYVGTSGIDVISIDSPETATSVTGKFTGGQQAADTIGINTAYNSGSVRGGQGTDTISFGAGSSLTDSHLNGNSNNDTIGVAGAAANLFTATIQGGQGNDNVVTAQVSASLVNGNKNVDTITAGNITDAGTVRGGQGADLITVNASNTGSVFGDLDNDIVTVAAGTHTDILFDGGDGNDNIQLTAASTLTRLTMNGGAGNDILNGNAAMTAATGTRADGGAGIDNINFAAFTQAATLVGGDDGDTIASGTAADTVTGDAGNDSITNAGGTDTFTGGTGNDLITSGVVGERYIQASGDSTAATVGWTNSAGGTLTDDNSVLVFGNGVDVISGAIGTFANGTRIATGINGATEINAGATNITNLAAGNYVIQGDWTAATNTWNVDTTGADTLFLQIAGGSLNVLANNGTTAIVFDGWDGTAAGNITSFIV
ncbi:hypothetical protein PMIT1312_01013 [Prochlorococcus marinus str. MIT 1312]|nr:hypothetical protein PMIT1312_01013 [Prochlorococcus marinus str. MIT 1312]